MSILIINLTTSYEQYSWYHNDEYPENPFRVKHKSGLESWWYKGRLRHRLDGPALILADGYKEWYFMGMKIECSSQKEFERYLKLLVFL